MLTRYGTRSARNSQPQAKAAIAISSFDPSAFFTSVDLRYVEVCKFEDGTCHLEFVGNVAGAEFKGELGRYSPAQNSSRLEWAKVAAGLKTAGMDVISVSDDQVSATGGAKFQVVKLQVHTVVAEKAARVAALGL